MGNLTELIARVEGATGSDLSIDAAVAVAVLGWQVLERGYADEQGNWQGRGPAVTSSLDAMVALVERESKGSWSVVRMYNKQYTATVHDGDVRAEAPTPALALLLAFLRASAAASLPHMTPEQSE